jgi:hypothetical protein
MTAEEMTKHGIVACAYRIEDNRDLRIEWRGTGLWAVKENGSCLNRDMQWEYEPQPSSRDQAFFDRCRFTLDQAMHLAVQCQWQDWPATTDAEFRSRAPSSILSLYYATEED